MKKKLLTIGAVLLLLGMVSCTKDEPEKTPKTNDAHKGIVIIPTTTTNS